MINLIRKKDGIVNAYHDSVLLHYAFSGRSGVIKGIGDELAVTAINSYNLRVKSGMGIIYGRQFEIIDYIDIAVLTPQSGHYYYTVYVEIDTRGFEETIEVKSTLSTVDFPNLGFGDNLATNKNGISRIFLCDCLVNSGGIVNVWSTREYLSTAAYLEKHAGHLYLDPTKNKLKVDVIENYDITLKHRGGVRTVNTGRDFKDLSYLVIEGYFHDGLEGQELSRSFGTFRESILLIPNRKQTISKVVPKQFSSNIPGSVTVFEIITQNLGGKLHLEFHPANIVFNGQEAHNYYVITSIWGEAQ